MAKKTHSKKRTCRSARSGDKQKCPFPYPPPSIHRFPFVKTVQEKGGGLTTREIAEKFGLSGRTVDVHSANIKRKLGCGSLAEVLVKAVEFKRTRDGDLPPPAL